MSIARTSVRSGLETVTDEYVAGQALPQAAYTAPDVFEADLDRVFYRTWLFVASAAELPRPGDHLTWSVGAESVVVTRAADGGLHAHANVCRHRGCRLRPDGAGHDAVLVCPYHQWTYGLDGTLRGTPHMGPEIRNRRPDLGLTAVALREAGGLVFVCLAEEPPPFDAAAAAVEAHVSAYRTTRTKVAARQHYRVQANWKVLVENNRECYHCSANHESFCLSNFDLGMSGDSRSSSRYDEAVATQRAQWADRGLPTEDVNFPDGSFFRVARLPLRDGYLTETTSGGLAAPLLGDLVDAHVGSIRVVTLPNSWSHVNADYVMTTRLTPVDVDTTDVDLVFLVREDAVEGTDYLVDDVARVWVTTSEEDWQLCEANAAGIASRAYRPGPLSPVTENSVALFHDWWLRQLTGRAG